MLEERVAVADFGSNSTRLMLMNVYPDGSFKLVDEIREPLRLAEHLDANGYLTPEIVQRTLETSRVFAEFCRAQQATSVVAVATSAMREAKNGPELTRRIFEESGLRFRTLSGEEEAYYGYLGVVNTLNVPNGIIVDIGGGSAEIVHVTERAAAEKASLPIGAITLTRAFLDSDRIGNDQLRRLEKHLIQSYAGVDWLRNWLDPQLLPSKESNEKGKSKGKSSKNPARTEPTDPATDSEFVINTPSPLLVGLGGTVRNIAKIYKRRADYPLDLLHGLSIPITAVYDIYNDLRVMTLAQRKEVIGLSPARADIIVAGIAVICTLARALGVSELLISGRGLRDGLFMEHLLGNGKGVPLVDDPAMYATRNLMRYYQVPEIHTQHVTELTLSLFDQLAELHGIGTAERRLLQIAALLHDVGVAVNYYNHGAHGLYLLTRAGIDGLSHRELLMVAYIVAAHSASGSPFKRWPDYRSLLNEQDENTVGKLGVLLRLSEALDRTENGHIRSVNCRVLKGEVTFIPEALPNGDFEIRKAVAVLPDFEKVFGVKAMISSA
jgi:exopolyphosphatase/guanosine-5'-triphosphate,3'-diphosphate pyrophosphatase